MAEPTLEQLRYPIGPFQTPEVIDQVLLDQWIATIETFPADLTRLVSPLSDEQLDTPYRPGGWTVRQLIHHVGDSHVNSYVRFKWTLTEDKPVIKAYFEDRWAELPDSKAAIMPALNFLEALHRKWTILLRSLNEAELNRCFVHPETGAEVTLKKNIGLYDWHCRHHLAHISGLLDREGWK